MFPNMPNIYMVGTGGGQALKHPDGIFQKILPQNDTPSAAAALL